MSQLPSSVFLSSDTLTIVASYISIHDLCSFRCVSSDWNDVVQLFTTNTTNTTNITNTTTSTTTNNIDYNSHSTCVEELLIKYKQNDDRNDDHDDINSKSKRVMGEFWMGKYKSFLLERNDRLLCGELFNVEHLKFADYAKRYFNFYENRKNLKRCKRLENKIKGNSRIVNNFDENYLKNHINLTKYESMRKFIHNVLNEPNRIAQYIDSIDNYKDIYSNNIIYSEQFINECLEHNRFFDCLLIYVNNNVNISENIYKFIGNHYSNGKIFKTLNIKGTLKLCNILSLTSDKSIMLLQEDLPHVRLFLLKSMFLGLENAQELKNLLISKCKTITEDFFDNGLFFDLLLNIVNKGMIVIKNDSFLKLANSAQLFKVNIHDYIDHCIKKLGTRLQYQVIEYLFEHVYDKNLSKMDEYFHKIFPSFSLECSAVSGVEDYYIRKLNRDAFTIIDNSNYVIHKLINMKRYYWDFHAFGKSLLEQFKKNKNLKYFTITNSYGSGYRWNFDELLQNIHLTPEDQIRLEQSLLNLEEHKVEYMY